MDIKQKRYIIIGAGRSGISAAKFISKEGAVALLSDNKSYEELKKDGYGIEDVVGLTGVELLFSRVPTEEEIASCDAMILSPGASPEILPCQIARKNNVKIYSEIEFANMFYKGSVVAITGTNGKTTTTTLIGELFKNASVETYIGGNIGDPFINYSKEASAESVISLEISSFQLSLNEKLHPKIAIVTNVTPDHLDRHKTMENYIDAKAEVFRNMVGDDVVILNYDDEIVRSFKDRIKCKCLFFSLKEKENMNAYLEGDDIIINIDNKKQKILSRWELSIIGLHNVANAMCGVLAALVYGLSKDSIVKTLREFKPVEHRVQLVAVKNGVRYINDSKGTNPEATMTAINAIDGRIVLILGGYDKESSFDELFKLIMTKDVKNIVVIGQTSEKIVQSAKKIGYNGCIMADSFEEALNKCVEISSEDDTVLLSPACASWGMFDNYEVRGNVFMEFVKKL